MTERRTTLTLEVQDKFSQALNNFSEGMNRAAEAMKKTSTTATKLNEVGRNVDEVGKKSIGMSDRLQTAFGGSSRAVNVFGNALGSAVGLSGEMGYALDVLMDSGLKAGAQFALLTGAVIVAGKAFDEISKQSTGKYLEMDAEAARKAAREMKSLEQATRDAMKARADAYGVDPSKSQALVGTLFEPAYAKEVAAQVKEAYETERLMVRAQADAKAMAELQLDVERKRAQALQDEVRAIMDATKTRLDYINSSQSTLRQLGGNLTWEEINTGVGAYGSYNVPGGNKSQMEMFLSDQQDQRAKQDRAKAEAEQRSRAAMSILKQTQSQALSLYNSLADGSSKTAKQVSADFADAFVGIMQAEADLNNNTGLSMIQLQQVFGKAFDGMSQDMVGKLLGVMDAGGAMAQSLISQLYAIAAGGGTAAEQIEAIRAALAGLPTDKYINIHLNYKASGPGGNQQGDEWNFTLEGEAYGTRAAYMQKYGDYGRANDAWQADHRTELNNKGVTGPGQANTRTGEVYQYAFGEHSIVTSPRMMLVGERGPERVDITPGTGARGGGGGGSVTVNFNSLVPPNEFEVRQLAAKLKSYMRI